MKIITNLFLGTVVLSLTACNTFRSIDYDDTSIYQYDVPNHPGVGYYEDMDYQDDYYKDAQGIMHRHMQREREYGYE